MTSSIGISKVLICLMLHVRHIQSFFPDEYKTANMWFSSEQLNSLKECICIKWAEECVISYKAVGQEWHVKNITHTLSVDEKRFTNLACYWSDQFSTINCWRPYTENRNYYVPTFLYTSQTPICEFHCTGPLSTIQQKAEFYSYGNSIYHVFLPSPCTPIITTDTIPTTTGTTTVATTAIKETTQLPGSNISVHGEDNFDSQRVDRNNYTGVIVGVVIGIVAIIASIVGIIVYRRNKRKYLQSNNALGATINCNDHLSDTKICLEQGELNHGNDEYSNDSLKCHGALTPTSDEDYNVVDYCNGESDSTSSDTTGYTLSSRKTDRTKYFNVLLNQSKVIYNNSHITSDIEAPSLEYSTINSLGTTPSNDACSESSNNSMSMQKQNGRYGNLGDRFNVLQDQHSLTQLGGSSSLEYEKATVIDPSKSSVYTMNDVNTENTGGAHSNHVYSKLGENSRDFKNPYNIQ